MIFPLAALFLAPGLWFVIIFVLGYKVRYRLLPRSEDPQYKFVFLIFFLSTLISGSLSLKWQPFAMSFVVLALYVVTVSILEYCDSKEKIGDMIFYSYCFGVVAAVVGISIEIFNLNKDLSVIHFIFGLCDLVENEDTAWRLSATFYNANVAASFLGALLLSGVYLLREKGRNPVFLCVGQALLLTAFLMTGSRGALLGLFVGLCFYFFGSRNKWMTISAAALFAIWFLLMMLFPQIFSRGELLFSDLDIRRGIWLNSIQMFKLHPVFGWGFLGTYFVDANVFTYLRVFHSHNLVLTALTFFGLVGFVICCYLEALKMRATLFLFKKGDKIAPLLFGIGGIFWGQGIFDCTVVSPQGGLLYFGVSALLIALAKVYAREDRRSVSSRI